MMRQAFMLALATALAAGASAQSFNLDIGQPGMGPPSSYGAAAGQTGHWLSLPATQGQWYFNLVDITGAPTAARLFQVGGTQTLHVNDPAVTGDDATLMNDFLITYTTVENCLFFYDMEPGEYEVFIYARMPAQPDVLAVTSVDQEPGVPHLLVGGEWPGQHQEFISYSRHTAFVTESGPQAGRLWMHSGVPRGGDLPTGAALNGVQIRKVVPIVGDLNGDGAVNVLDLLLLLGAWGQCAACAPGSCAADLNGSCTVDVLDLLMLLANWG